MPHYMKYYLTRSKAAVELTPTEYGARVRVEFDGDYDKFISVLPVQGVCGYELDAKNGRLYCYTDCNELDGYDK